MRLNDFPLRGLQRNPPWPISMVAKFFVPVRTFEVRAALNRAMSVALSEISTTCLARVPLSSQQ